MKTKTKTKSPWRPIKSCKLAEWSCLPQVDLWLQISASPITMGMSDSFRVTDAFRQDGKWFHYCDGKQMELDPKYITHWMPIPKEPPAL